LSNGIWDHGAVRKCSGCAWPGGAGVWPRGALLLVRTARPFHVKTSGSARLRPTCRLLPLGSVPSMRQTVCARFFCCDNDTRAPALVGNPCQPRSTPPTPALPEWACGQVGEKAKKASKAFHFKSGDWRERSASGFSSSKTHFFCRDLGSWITRARFQVSTQALVSSNPSSLPNLSSCPFICSL
jgi:hypothetical protein